MHARNVAIVFAGQGVQHVGMGMELYQRSPIAREIWDRADQFCRQHLGFSILSIVRDNPQQFHLFHDRNTTTHKHPQGVLFLTQFTQVAMLVYAVAAYRHWAHHHATPRIVRFAGHSLGEFSALAALDLIPLPAAIRLVYQRGRIMQQCIRRDATGRSPYGMVVVRPHIMRQSESTLHELVAHVRSRHTQTLEIANYNILDEQYAVVGSHSALGSLTERCIALAKSQGVQRNPVRSVPGIDIPFHSSLLRKSVPQFAQHVRQALPASRDVTALAQRYIPNVTGRPFDGCAEQLHEYLAHQLASPVQWITTQRTLLCDTTCQVDAVIEFGPNPVLGAMLSRSASLFAHAVTTAVYHQHELLGYAA